LSNLEIPIIGWRTDQLPKTIAHRTRRIYDAVALVYPLSTMFFHSKAHKRALEMSGIANGMRVLEVATGSGEMFRRLVRANQEGKTVGIDLSPNMASRTQQRIRKEFPGAETMCKAVDARYMPFRGESFDSVVCCYLLELLSNEDILLTLSEFRRILRADGRLTLVLIGENTSLFNQIYRVCGTIAPAFWGRQVSERVPSLLLRAGFAIQRESLVRQGFYPSRVLIARNSSVRAIKTR
jgi:ubiquinone/menaquinone biosynthesis C-methylase UbiE